MNSLKKRMANDRYTDAVDDVLVKIMNKDVAGISRRDIRHLSNSTKPYIPRPNSAWNQGSVSGFAQAR